jgi:hypothetical protein
MKHPEMSTLFLVRVWRGDVSQGQQAWRGKVQHAVSGESHHFDDWAEMLAWLVAMLGSDVVPKPGERRESDER